VMSPVVASNEFYQGGRRIARLFAPQRKLTVAGTDERLCWRRKPAKRLGSFVRESSRNKPG
jgi:hypothetical protein